MSAGLAVVLATVAAPRASADEYCHPSGAPRASVLVIHGGAWMGGSARDGRNVCAPLAAMGYRVRSLEYPLYTVPGSIAYAQRAAAEETRLGRPVYATGISAGGTIAEYLAVRSGIDGAVVVAPLSDLVNWRHPAGPGYWGKLKMTPEMRRRYSPYFNVTVPAPLRIIHSPQDEMVPYEQSVRMAARCGSPCELVTLQLGLGHASVGSRGPLLQWFRERAAHPRFAPGRIARPPSVSGAEIRPGTFAVGRGGTRRRGRRTVPRRGTTFRYTLSEPARVSIAIDRLGGGRAGTLTVNARAGGNATRFAGIVSGRPLRPGPYVATLTAVGASGLRSTAHRLPFRVARAAPRSRPR